MASGRLAVCPATRCIFLSFSAFAIYGRIFLFLELTGSCVIVALLANSKLTACVTLVRSAIECMYIRPTANFLRWHQIQSLLICRSASARHDDHVYSQETRHLENRFCQVLCTPVRRFARSASRKLYQSRSVPNAARYSVVNAARGNLESLNHSNTVDIWLQSCCKWHAGAER